MSYSKETAPPAPPALPDDCPDEVMCFIERDDDFFMEIENLSKAVIIYGESYNRMEVHQAVKLAVDTGLVREEEIRVAKLARDRVLIHLPKGLMVDTFIRALPSALWEQGFSAQLWTQLDGATLIMPRFKLMIDLVDFSVHLWKEYHVIRAVSSFGIFLGSVAPEHKSDLSA